ncbi:hypothetical protein HYU92_01015 [Candidatus Curtissbacteria bacterium]|nr:hypothetical protein [Candidatus Curtissbacteria bacterium]
MVRLLPFSFLLLFASLFGLAWIVVEVDPDSTEWYIFALFIILLFLSLFNFLGLVLYFARTRFYRRYSANWYFKTSYKMAFFFAFFLAIVATLALFSQINTFNVTLAILAVSLFAFWSYLGKRG